LTKSTKIQKNKYKKTKMSKDQNQK
jgi:hypothetical protein